MILKDYLKQFSTSNNKNNMAYKSFRYVNKLPINTFIYKEIVHPTYLKNQLPGYVSLIGRRHDSPSFIAACLPYCYHTIITSEMIRTIWPDAINIYYQEKDIEFS